MLISASLGLASFSRPAAAYPEPSAVRTSWELSVNCQPLRVISVQSLDGRTQWYWYVSYKVVNRTGQERLFVPKILLASNEGDLIPAGQNVPSSVYAAIKTQMGNPLVESPARAAGRLLQGEDFAIESLAVWPVLEHDVASLSIFIGGLSGESKAVTVGTTETLVTKTLMLTYELPGDVPMPQMQTIVPSRQTWVMR